jgi:hypothetical protein
VSVERVERAAVEESGRERARRVKKDVMRVLEEGQTVSVRMS